VLHVSKYFERSSRTSSESLDSDSVVNPTRSANSTETSRRSAAGTWCSGAEVAGTEAPWPNGVPHSPQNFWPGGLTAPHDGHEFESVLPHSPQNFWPGGLS